jgi:large subunit ribosomal protein L21
MYAVVESGGKQYRVTPGQTVDVETIPGEVGATVELGRVLAFSKDDKVLTGDAVKGLKVTGSIEHHDRGVKIIVFKFKRKKQYRRTQGHRQNYTRVKVHEIQA